MLCKYLYQKILRFEDENNHSHFRPKFDPHITLIYTSISEIYFNSLKEKLLTMVSNILPIEIQYVGLYCSDYNTINLRISPNQCLFEIHQKVLNELYPEYFQNSNPDELLAFFNTTNIGVLYTPHLTVDKFSSKKESKNFISLFDDFIPVKQKVFSFELMDASYSPMKFLYSIK